MTIRNGTEMIDLPKFGRAHGVLGAPPTRSRTIITDTSASRDVVAAPHKASIRVIPAEPLRDGAEAPVERGFTAATNGSWSEGV
jgi:hypothetical protein